MLKKIHQNPNDMGQDMVWYHMRVKEHCYLLQISMMLDDTSSCIDGFDEFEVERICVWRGEKRGGQWKEDQRDGNKGVGGGRGAEPLSLGVVPGKSPQAKEMDEKVSNNQLVSDLQNMTDEQLQQSADRIRRILPTLSLTLKDGGEKLKRSLQLHEDELRRRRLLPLQKVEFLLVWFFLF